MILKFNSSSDMQCWSMSRSISRFVTEFSLDLIEPPFFFWFNSSRNYARDINRCFCWNSRCWSKNI